MPILIPAYWRCAVQHLQQDPTLATIIRTVPDDQYLCSHGNPWRTVAHAIVSQQISVIAANSIWRKLEKTQSLCNVARFSKIPSEILLNCGLSRRKVEYLQNFAIFFLQTSQNFWERAPWAELRTALLAQRGIGPWTADMVAIFYRLEADILPLGDIGLINALQRYYAVDDNPSEQQILSITNLWRPYRSVATWYLWRALDNAPVSY